MPAKITRTEVIDCTCSADEPHGSKHTYEYHGCGCEPCRTAVRRDHKLRRAGITRMTSAGRSMAYIQLLGERHYSQRMIARELGTYPYTINRIARGKVIQVQKDFEARLLAIPLPSMDKFGNEARVHGTLKRYYQGCRCIECREARNSYLRDLRRRQSTVWSPEGATHRLINKLKAEGHTQEEIAKRAGIAPSSITRVMSDEKSRTYRTTHNKIVEAFRKDPERTQ